MLEGPYMAPRLKLVSTVTHRQAVISHRTKIHYGHICGIGKNRKSRCFTEMASDKNGCNTGVLYLVTEEETKTRGCTFLKRQATIFHCFVPLTLL